MDSITLPSPPITSDPALYDDWEEPCPENIPSSTHSDDLEAIYLVQEETRLRKNKAREVIQHRAWKLPDVFRSEEDHPEETPVRPKYTCQLPPPSSPPIFKMPSASSPVAYPSSSPPPASKRTRPTKPLEVRKPKSKSGFLIDEDSGEEDDFSLAQPAPKRRMLEHRSQSPLNEIDANEVAPTSHSEKVAVLPAAARRVGGFLVEDDDDDDDDEAEPTAPARIKKLSQAPVSSLPSIFTSSGAPNFPSGHLPKRTQVTTCSGHSMSIEERKKAPPVSFEQLVAARSTTKTGRAKRSYYGIDIHGLIDEAKKDTAKENSRRAKEAEEVIPSIEGALKLKPRQGLMWTEKYRAKNFMELVGDDRTHRQVLRWLKSWDPIVFPKSGKAKPVALKGPGGDLDEEKPHKKILLLTGPPGLGKTTLAHVCARQAGYEVMEINASDDRSSAVVKGRIRTSVGTESVKAGSTITSKSGQVKKADHPLCVIVDEVDGVVTGSGGSGEGGFIKALIDLILLDQKNSSIVGSSTSQHKKKRKGDDFKLLRPLILICNDVYHPSLRPLRQSSFAEIIHVRKPPLDAVVTRMKSVFEKEGVQCDSEAVRRLCEATWGVNAAEARKGKEGTGEGDLRGIMVVGEWAARKIKASKKDGMKPKMTKKWVEDNMTSSLAHGGGGARGVGRGGTKDLVSRVFQECAGFPKTGLMSSMPEPSENEVPITQLGVAELVKRAGMERLREMVDTSGEIDRIMTEIFAEYPGQPFNDDSILSKPDAAYEWLHFHDTCSSRVFTQQNFELAPYLSQPVLACHNLFASPARHNFGGQAEYKKWGEEEVVEEPLPFTGPRADYSAHEAEKENRATILALQASLNAILLRSFRSPEDIATDLLPYLVRMLSPDIKPIIVGGSGDQKGIASVRRDGEKALVKRSVNVMSGVGVIFERGKLEGDFGSRTTQWIYRMEPPLDTLVTFETANPGAHTLAPVRYAVRQVLDQEYQKNIIVRENAARQARFKAGGHPDDDTEFSLSSQKDKGKELIDFVSEVKKDFFGRVVVEERMVIREGDDGKNKMRNNQKEERNIWVTYHEGFSNAVRKPITVEELLRGL